MQAEAGSGPGDPFDGATPLLELRNLRKTYGGIRALKGVDYAVWPGRIQCLAGGNGSGKSTLIKIIAGVERPDPGASLRVDGLARPFWTPTTAVREGIEVIYQDLSLFPNLTVAENIALSGWVRQRTRWVHGGHTRAGAAEALSRIGVQIDLTRRVGELSMARQQLVAVARALTARPRLLIMDEPTTALTRREIDALFRVVRGLAADGIAVLFVSHKLDEVLEIASKVTVLRDGEKVGDVPASTLDADLLGRLIAGGTLDAWNRAPASGSDQVVLRVDNLSCRGQFEGVSLELRRGEVVGLTGLLGSGRTELAWSLFGLNPPDAGTVTVAGQPVRIGSVPEAMALGIAYVPEDRAVQGLIMEHSITWNWTLPSLRRFLGRGKLLSVSRETGCVETGLRDLGVRSAGRSTPVHTLSGGNQQRVLLGKWLTTSPRILILDGPTVGIDVAAKRDIHQRIRKQALDGTAILLISDELPEVLAVTDRFYVMQDGRLTGEFASDKTSGAAVRALLEGPVVAERSHAKPPPRDQTPDSQGHSGTPPHQDQQGGVNGP